MQCVLRRLLKLSAQPVAVIYLPWPHRLGAQTPERRRPHEAHREIRHARSAASRLDTAGKGIAFKRARLLAHKGHTGKGRKKPVHGGRGRTACAKRTSCTRAATAAPACPPPAFPAEGTLACSFDVHLVRRVGQAMGEEAASQGVGLLLGPGLNMKRSPLCGRKFEYFSEDPLLAAALGQAMVEGIQAAGVGACVKHFAVNNQEEKRMSISADVDERALREIYLRAFELVVKGESLPP